MDPASLERYYSLNLPIRSGDFFGNVLRSHVAEEKRKWVRVGKQMDKGMWDMIPSEVNAYYNRESSVCFEVCRALTVRSSVERDRVPCWNPAESVLLQGLVRDLPLVEGRTS